MDRDSTWKGAGRRAGRVPPRVAPRSARRGDVRTAAWDGARRWWLVALGTLAAALVVPRLAGAQGLRSSVATVSLTVIAPPRTGGAAADSAGRVVSRLGPSVADVSLQLPIVGGDLSAIAVRLEGQMPGDATLYLRRPDGGLSPVSGTWAPLPVAPVATFRVIASDGTRLGAASWTAAFRLTPRDTTRGDIAVRRTIEVPGSR